MPSITVTTAGGTSARATFTINPTQPPGIVSVTPNSGTGLLQVFTLVYSDPQGAAEMNENWMLINTSNSAGSACFVYYHPQTNLMYLRNDAGSAWLTPALTPGGSGTLSNSQCTLNANGSSVVASGNNLTINVSLTFSPTFTGTRNVYMFASGLSGLNSGWVKEGSWIP
jgi:hypothetical protein